jgi:hypothetical protein
MENLLLNIDFKNLAKSGNQPGAEGTSSKGGDEKRNKDRYKRNR